MSDNEDIDINNDTVAAEMVNQQQQEMGVIRDGIADSSDQEEIDLE